MRWGDKLGGPNVILRVLIIREVGASESEEMSQWKQGSERCKATNQGIWAAFRSRKRQGNEFFPRLSRRSAALLTHLSLQNCKLTKLYCFRLLSVWECVMESIIGN